ncbi:MAG: hypothetical protein GY860_27780 [Desulfobacteraceae bacterium]|nr:hypothetical protein [Desulfobacteraceae bacterium]
MLTIRQNQKKILKLAARDDFVERMLVHLNTFFSEHYEALGDDSCRELIDLGIKNAENHEIVNERDVCKYIDLMVSFGVDFDKDPKFPWAGKILTDQSWKNATQKTEALFNTGIKHLSESP